MEFGSWLIAASAAVALAVAFGFRTRAPVLVVATLLTFAGAGIGWGGMLVQPDPSTGEFAAAVTALAFLIPAHVRIVLGPFGSQA